MDDEVSNILKKWNTTAQKANGKSNEEHQNNSYINSRTFTRPKKALTKLSPDDRVPMEAKVSFSACRRKKKIEHFAHSKNLHFR